MLQPASMRRRAESGFPCAIESNSGEAPFPSMPFTSIPLHASSSRSVSASPTAQWIAARPLPPLLWKNTWWTHCNSRSADARCTCSGDVLCPADKAKVGFTLPQFHSQVNFMQNAERVPHSKETLTLEHGKQRSSALTLTTQLEEATQEVRWGCWPFSLAGPPEFTHVSCMRTAN